MKKMKRFMAVLSVITFILLGIYLNQMGVVGGMREDEKISQFVTKKGGTEQPFNNSYWNEKRLGIYVDYNTGKPLFSSLDKYDSGTGWPSFTKPIDESLIKSVKDNSLGIERVEVRTDESHLGHVFDDGPNGGSRFCINSAALKFVPYENLEDEGLGEYKQLFPYNEAVFAGGCFWGVETLFEELNGVVSVIAGYSGGKIKNPSYKVVSSGTSGHTESVLVIFDPNLISYRELVDYFWRLHNPTQLNRQGPDVGSQYRSVIFYIGEEQKKIAQESRQAFEAKGIFKEKVVTEIIPLEKFWSAEEYHQDFSKKNPSYVCHALRAE